MKITYSYRERLAGLFMLFAMVGILAFIIGAAFENRWLEPRIAFHMSVVRGEGLRTGSPVLLSGIEVGEVGELRIMQDNRIDVELLVREQHAHRVRHGTTAEVKRLLGIGEKRIHLVSNNEISEELPSGAVIMANEPTDILDALSNLDLSRYINTLDRAVSAMETVLVKLEEEDRLERMMEAFDQMGPTMEKANHLMGTIDEPLEDLLKDKSLRRTFKGADKLFNDPNTRKAMAAMSNTFEPERTSRVIERMDRVLERFEVMMASGGAMEGSFKGANKLFNDPKTYELLDSMEKLTDAEKLERLVDNMAVVADQMAKIGPEIPTISREVISAMREAVIVLKALQKTWLLDEEAKEVLKELKKKK